MHKQTKYFFIGLVALLLGSYFFVKLQTQTDLAQSQVQDVQSDKLKSDKKEPLDIATDFLSKTSQESFELTKKPAKTLAKTEPVEQIPLLYSFSPIVNAQVILAHYEQCMYVLEKDSSGEPKYYMFSIKTEKQKAVLEKHHQFCQRINIENPDFHLDSPKDLWELTKKMKPDSFIEKVLSRDIQLRSRENSQELYLQFFEELSNAPDELFGNFNVIYMVEEYFWDYSSPELFRRLNSQDLPYLMTTRNFALQYYSCWRSQLCGENSSFMLQNCMMIEAACDVKDYKQFYKLILTEGQQKDMQIVLAYLEQVLGSPKDNN